MDHFGLRGETLRGLTIERWRTGRTANIMGLPETTSESD